MRHLANRNQFFAAGDISGIGMSNAQSTTTISYGLNGEVVSALEARQRISSLSAIGSRFLNSSEGRAKTFDQARDAYEAVYLATQVDSAELLPDALKNIWNPIIGPFSGGWCVRQFPEAIALELKVLEAMMQNEAAIPKEFLPTATNQLGFLYAQTNKRDRSEHYFLRAIDLTEQKAEQDHSWQDVAGAIRNLAHRYEAWGDLPKAIELARRGIEVADRMQVDSEWPVRVARSKFTDTTADWLWQKRANRASLGHFLHVSAMGDDVPEDECGPRLDEAGRLFSEAEELMWKDSDVKAIAWDEGKLAGLPGAHYCLFLFDCGKHAEVVDRAVIGQRADGKDRRNSEVNVSLFKMLQGLALVAKGDQQYGFINLAAGRRKLQGLQRTDLFETFGMAERLDALKCGVTWSSL